MALKKDKAKVLDEVWTEQRVKDFLAVQPAADVEADFHVLLKAYQSMRLENFEEFVTLFVADCRNINATNPQGETALAIIQQHKKATDYVTVLINNGAS